MIGKYGWKLLYTVAVVCFIMYCIGMWSIAHAYDLPDPDRDAPDVCITDRDFIVCKDAAGNELFRYDMIDHVLHSKSGQIWVQGYSDKKAWGEVVTGGYLLGKSHIILFGK